ncbi:MAG: hypothetical protein ACLSDQ_04860 [Adlercreutzia equolifaciens]
MAETTMEAVPIPTEEPKREKKKRKFSFPSAFTILFIVTIIAVICTFVPAGQYSKLLYDSEAAIGDDDADRRGVRADATQQTLDELGVKIDISSFTAAPSPRRCLFRHLWLDRIRCRLPTFPTPWSGA